MDHNEIHLQCGKPLSNCIIRSSGISLDITVKDGNYCNILQKISIKL